MSLVADPAGGAAVAARGRAWGESFMPAANRNASRRRSMLLAMLCIGGVAAGCKRQQVPKQPLTPAPPDPVGEARALLTAYAGGQPLGSESINYEDLIRRVTAVDAEKGAKLKAFADEALQKGKVDAVKAKKLAAEF
jgi:hypothetical protein